MRYGYFSDDHRQYRITTPFTPIKWCNYVGTLAFGGIVDQTGGALICKGDPALNRISKYISQMPASDFKGTTIYIRWQKPDGSYEVYSPFFTPTLKDLDRYECQVGLSYSRFVSEYQGIRTEITVFVPRDGEVFLQDIVVENLGAPRSIDVIPVVEFTHFDALKQLTNADWVPQTMTLKAHRQGTSCVLEQYAFMKRDTAVNYFTANRPVSSFDGDRKKFLGRHEYGSWQKPLSLEAPELNNSEALRGDNIGALMLHLGELKTGERQRAIVQLGQAASLSEAGPSIEKYRDEAVVDRAFAELGEFWQSYLSLLQVDTPSASFNTMVNIHNPRQCHTTKNWSRYLSLYQLGYGARGIGFRDSSQDLLGVMSHMPEEALELALKLLSMQKRNGSAMHQFNPLTMEGSQGDSLEEPDRPKYYGDDHLWIIYTMAAYIKETGNLSVLDRKVPFYDKDPQGRPLEEGTVWEHLARAIEFTWSDRGRHGLPLLGFADWNDTVNLPKGAESLMVANLFGKAILELIPICDAYDKADFKAKIMGYYESMRSIVNDTAWDGAWYVRWFDHEGRRIGTAVNQAGKIWVNGQSWPVISGFASEEKREKALDSVYTLLNTQYGIKLSAPGYNGFDPVIGGVTTYPPGAKENGGIFLHANPWMMIAETLRGNGDRAFEYYNQINPAQKNDILDIFESEPYCYPQNILGNEHPQFGMGRNAWLSGTASWTYIAATQYILGIRPELDGLTIDPCLPKAWDRVTVERRFRGSVFSITIVNPDQKMKGVASLLLDGKKIEGNKIPLLPAGHYRVEAYIGR
jgi:cellobiose phosphorylase